MSTSCRIMLGAAVIATMIAPIAPAGAAGGVSIMGVTRSGETLTVNGSASFEDQPFLGIASDPSGDGSALSPFGGDLRGLAAATSLDGQVRLRFSVDPGSAGGGAPGVVWGWSFCVGGSACYELNVQRMTVATDGTLPTAGRTAIYRCATAACDPAAQAHLATGSFATYFTGSSIVLTLPATVGLSLGTTITSAGGQAAFTAAGTADPRLISRGSGDTVASHDAYRVPTREVSIGIAPQGTDPAAVAYGPAVAPAPNGSWSASLDVSGPAGPQAVFARACFGSNNCGYATATVSL